MEFSMGGGLLQKVVPAELVIVLGKKFGRMFLCSHILSDFKLFLNEEPEMNFIILEIVFQL